MTFHHSKHVQDGIGYAAGDILVVGLGPFMHAVIIGFDEVGNARVSRPYAYASCVGTTGPTPLLGVETYTINAASLKKFKIISSGRVAV